MKKLFLVIIFVVFLFGVSSVNATGVIDTVSLGVSSKPIAVVVDEGTSRVYVADQTNQKIYVIDGDVNNIIATIPLNGKPEAISFNKNTNRLYVAWIDNKEAVGQVNLFISIIDGNNFNILNTFSKLAGSGFVLDGRFLQL